MQLIANEYKNIAKPMFLCTKHTTDHLACTHNHFIYYDDLVDEIYNQLSLQIEQFFNSSLYDDLCKKIIIEINTRAQRITKDRLQKELQILNKNIKDKYKTLSAKTDMSGLDAMRNSQKFLLRKITESDTSFDITFSEKIDALSIILKEYLHESITDKNALKILIEKIEIGHLEKNSYNENIQKLKIHYPFKIIS